MNKAGTVLRAKNQRDGPELIGTIKLMGPNEMRMRELKDEPVCLKADVPHG